LPKATCARRASNEVAFVSSILTRLRHGAKLVGHRRHYSLISRGTTRRTKAKAFSMPPYTGIWRGRIQVRSPLMGLKKGDS
jgi:hypothetical protein